VICLPNYTREGKILTPLTDEQFSEGMEKGKFVDPTKHKAFIALLHYSAVRKQEALRARREQFHLEGNNIIFEVGKRLKHGMTTPPLTIPLTLPFAKEIWEVVENTESKQKVFPFSSKTAYNIVRRVFKYPHYHRLSRITNFFLEGWTVADVHSWTGLTLSALNFYLGIVTTKKMGESLGNKKPS